VYKNKYTLVLLISLTSINNAAAEDPMRPPSWISIPSNVVQDAAQALVLQQILISKTRKLAVINEKVVAEGEMVSGARVKAIANKWVRVVRGNRSITLRLAPTTKEYIRER
jgi:hypothetical protein